MLRAAASIVACILLVVVGALAVLLPSVVRDQNLARDELRPTPVAGSHVSADTREVQYRGRTATIVLVRTDGDVRGEDVVLPPGVPEVPGPGEAYLSPELRGVVEEELQVPADTGSVRVAGLIGPAGLVSPSELRAVVGVPRGTAGLQPVEWRHHEHQAVAATLLTLDGALALMAMLLLVMTAASLAWMCAKAVVPRHARRDASLELLGVTRLRRLRLLVVIGLIPFAVAAPVAAGALWVVSRGGVRLARTELSAFQNDASPGVAAYTAGLLVGLVWVALIVLGGSSRSASTTVPLPAPPVRGIAGLIVLGTGLSGQTVLQLTDLGLAGPTRALAIVVLALCCCLGIPAGLPFAIKRAARLGAERASDPVSVVSRRFVEVHPSLSTRLGSVVVATLLALGVSVPLTTMLSSGVRVPPDATNSPVTGVVDLRTAAAPFSALELESLPGVSRALPLMPATDPRSGEELFSVLVASCPQVRDLSETNGGSCDGLPGWLTSGGLPLEERLGLRSKDLSSVEVGGGSLRVPGFDHVLDLDAGPALEGTLVVPPDAGVGGSANEFVVRLSSPAAAEALPLIAAMHLDASAQIDLGYAGWSLPKFLSQIEALQLLMLAIVVITALSLVVGAAAEAQAGVRRMSSLHTLGMARKDIGRAWFTGLLLPSQVLVFAGFVAAAMAARAFSVLDDRSAVPVATMLLWYLLAAAGLALALVLGTIVGRSADPGPGVEAER